MKAVVLKRPKEFVFMDIPRPTLREENHVLIKVEACGICGSDLRYWTGENPWALHTLGKHVDNPPNMILGHEFSGVVVEVNAPQYEHLLGKRVGGQAFRVCGACKLCTSGHENLCQNTLHIGHAQGWGEMDYFPGAHAEYCLAWADLLHLMDDHVSFGQETTRDFLGVAVHAVGRANLIPGATVLCIGGGPVGLSIALVAKAKGAGRIFVSDPSPIAQHVIRQYADLVCIDPTVQNLIDALEGHLCDAVFDSVGTVETLQQGLPLLAKAGTHVNMAVHNAPLPWNAMAMGSERTATTSSNAFYRDEQEAHALIASGAVDVQPMITHRFPLDEVQAAFDLLLSTPKQAYKVILQP